MITYNDYENDIVTLTFDNDQDVDCAIVSIFPAGDKDYIALLPIEDFEKDDAEVFIATRRMPKATPESRPSLTRKNMKSQQMLLMNN